MEDIKVGEYVRTKTKIGQIILIENKNKHWRYIVKFKKRTTHLDRYSILKHSFNLIDLTNVDEKAVHIQNEILISKQIE